MKAYLEPAEVERLEETTTNLRDRLLIRMLFRLGCRVSEALALTVDDIDIDGVTVTIQHLKSRIKMVCPYCNDRLAKSNIFCAKCGVKVSEAITEAKDHRKMRTIPIDQDTLKILNEFIDRGGPVSRDGKQYIFGISRNTAWRVVTKCAVKADLPKLINPESGKTHTVSPHRLRDAFAVHAVKHDDSGDGLRLLQEHLGHASFNTTAKYRKVAGEELKAWYSKLWRDQGKIDG
jgi:integrase/recombinase XerD